MLTGFDPADTRFKKDRKHPGKQKEDSKAGDAEDFVADEEADNPSSANGCCKSTDQGPAATGCCQSASLSSEAGCCKSSKENSGPCCRE
jgi:hypothetical protein